MRKFRVLVRGENFLLEFDGAAKRLGFYTTRFVEALDKNEAERRAVESLRQEDRLRGRVLNDPKDPPMLFAEEIEEVSSFETAGDRPQGLAFYEDQRTAH